MSRQRNNKKKLKAKKKKRHKTWKAQLSLSGRWDNSNLKCTNLPQLSTLFSTQFLQNPLPYLSSGLPLSKCWAQTRHYTKIMVILNKITPRNALHCCFFIIWINIFLHLLYWKIVFISSHLILWRWHFIHFHSNPIHCQKMRGGLHSWSF